MALLSEPHKIPTGNVNLDFFSFVLRRTAGIMTTPNKGDAPPRPSIPGRLALFVRPPYLKMMRDVLRDRKGMVLGSIQQQTISPSTNQRYEIDLMR